MTDNVQVARKPKNLLIFSDGTGQAGGLRPDQRLSNIYKMYRATRNGPDSPIDPADQIAFYDPGLGSEELSAFKPISYLRKFLDSVLGSGLTRNVADCYENILRVYEPGDRIYLFGFSRGAYTVRSLGGVINLCGVPTMDRDGNSIPRHGSGLRRIADEAVHDVYEHGAGRARGEFEAEREEKGRRFRNAYGTQEANPDSPRGNVAPYFIGVFDSVAALGSSGLKKTLLLVGAAVGGLLLCALLSWFLSFIPGLQFLPVLAIVVGIAIILVGWRFSKARIKTIHDYPEPGQKNWHWSSWRFKHYDRSLDPRVGFARHAQAIDETRADFERVSWGKHKDVAANAKGWLEQRWFPGNHSDIGGSYPETECRLSDLALKWMVDEARNVPHPIIVDESKLQMFPSAAGMQHDEVASLLDSYSWWVPKSLRKTWPVKFRPSITLEACDPSVLERLKLASVCRLGTNQPYRPEILRNDPALKEFFEPSGSTVPAAAGSPLSPQTS